MTPPTSLESCQSSVTQHRHTCLQQGGATALAEKVGRWSTTFRTLTCASGHVFRPIPTERCRHRLCPNCARHRQRPTIRRLWPVMRALRRQHPRDRWVFITLTAQASPAPLRSSITRLQRWVAQLRRTIAWKTASRGAVAGIEVTYRPGRGWHVHLHLLASRRAWWRQADLAAAWQRATKGNGTIVDMRDRDADVRSSRCRTLTYPFKPINLTAWGPAQVVEFTGLTRVKLAECYGAMRGFTSTFTDAPNEPARHDPPPPLLIPGAPCPRCRRPLVTQWFTRQNLPHADPRPSVSLAPPDRPRAA